MRAGDVQSIQDGQLVFDPTGDPPVETIAIETLRSIRLLPPEWTAPQGILVVDNERAESQQEKSGKIKLKAGFHQFSLPYWHATGGAMLQLQYEGPGVARTDVTREMLYRLADTEFDPGPSSMLDADGLRLPEAPPKTDNGINFRMSSWKQAREVRSVREIRMQPVTQNGRSPMIHPGVGPQDKPFAIVYTGYIKVPSDGEYTFHLKSDGGSQLHIGATPRWLSPVVTAPRPNDWKLTLAPHGEARGALTGWNQDGAQFAIKLGPDTLNLNVPRTALRELWSTPVASGELTVDRKDEPADIDSVYAKNAAGQVQRVSGTVVGTTQDSLKFVYQEMERTIKLERVVGIVLKGDKLPAPEGAYLELRLPGGARLPVHARSLDADNSTFETAWHTPVTLPRASVGEAHVMNGAMQWLSALTPATVEQTPWFDRIIPFRTDTSTSGTPLRIAQQDYERGLCLHSRTILEYDLAAGYDRFRCQLGLQRPEGDLGNATVRVLADGNVILEVPALTATTAVQTVDLDIAQKSKLRSKSTSASARRRRPRRLRRRVSAQVSETMNVLNRDQVFLKTTPTGSNPVAGVERALATGERSDTPGNKPTIPPLPRETYRRHAERPFGEGPG
ncbi:MAG: NPCBM/NEW2 domain-containing protein [Planctomycetaceae bacterium]